MHSPDKVFNLLKSNGIQFFTGVPDSLLKDFCAYVTDNTTEDEHIITANEGNAVALATGHYLGSGNPALVYMQNSGIGNAVNPLTSLADSEVYSVPMLIMIGWRGEPGVKDEPQHVKQGRVMTSLLDSLEIPWYQLNSDTQCVESLINTATNHMNSISAPVVLLVSKGVFEKYSLSSDTESNYVMTREEAIEVIVEGMDDDDLVVSTTGMASRELYEIRERRMEGHDKDFLTVGAMGHTGSIALGLALSRPDKRVFCIDGDGSLLMHMGALGISGKSSAKNLIHVVINNGAHDSVGGQPTMGFDVALSEIASSCGYKVKPVISDQASLKHCFCGNVFEEGPLFIEVRVRKGARKDLGRPKSSPLENKKSLMSLLGNQCG